MTAQETLIARYRERCIEKAGGFGDAEIGATVDAVLEVIAADLCAVYEPMEFGGRKVLSKWRFELEVPNA